MKKIKKNRNGFTQLTNDIINELLLALSNVTINPITNNNNNNKKEVSKMKKTATKNSSRTIEVDGKKITLTGIVNQKPNPKSTKTKKDVNMKKSNSKRNYAGNVTRQEIAKMLKESDLQTSSPVPAKKVINKKAKPRKRFRYIDLEVTDPVYINWERKLAMKGMKPSQYFYELVDKGWYPKSLLPIIRKRAAMERAKEIVNNSVKPVVNQSKKSVVNEKVVSGKVDKSQGWGLTKTSARKKESIKSLDQQLVEAFAKSKKVDNEAANNDSDWVCSMNVNYVK